MSAHARLSASAAHRWMVCAGSVNGPAVENKSSIYAAAGTFAHDIAARCLDVPSSSVSDFLLYRGKVDGFDLECDQEMVDAIDLYVDNVRDDLIDGDLTWIEMPLLDALQKIDSDLGGTADFVRYRPSTKSLRVVDFKFGSGKFVSADDNPQAKVYALGVMMQVGLPVSEVEVVIVQPRFEGADPVRSWKFPVADVMGFVADVQEAAELTRSHHLIFAAGDHCGFCPRARDCPELERKHHALVAMEFEIVGERIKALPIDPANLATTLASIPLVKERIKAIEEFAYAQATQGVEIPGYKLVDKRATRKWRSEGDVIEWAQAIALDPFAPRELLSPAQIEAKLKEFAPRGKKKDAGAVLEPFVEKISSGTALVPVSDNRPAAKRISVDDFKEIA